MHMPMSYEYLGDTEWQPKDENGVIKLAKDWTFVDTWKAMEKLPKDKVRAIGVSNFSEKTCVPFVIGRSLN
jgi:diketogulonate reductase-like aldo/keto reductase